MAKDKLAAAPAPTPAPPAAQTPASAPAPKLTKARVLATGVFGMADDVAELPADVLAQGVAAGLLDPHPDAVAYAASLNKA